MHSCRKSRETIIDLLSGEIPPAKRQSLLDDIESCPICRHEYLTGAQALQTLARAQQSMLPQASHWPEYEAALRYRLATCKAAVTQPPRREVRWYWWLGWAAALAAVWLAVKPRESVARTAVDPFGNRLHMQRVDLLLRAVEHGGELDDQQNQRRHARRILQDNTVLRLQAEALGDTRTAATLSQFEPLLLDVAHLPEHPEPEEWDALRKRIWRESVYIENSLQDTETEARQ